nr:hypothetical protein [Tanacetum cinerariifolium]
MFDTGVLDDEEVVAKKEVSTADLVTTGGEIVTTVGDERKKKTKKPKRKDIELPQTSVPTEVVADKAVYEEMYDSVERAATTTTSLDAEQDMGIISKTQFTAILNEPSSIETSLGSRPRHQETIRDAAAQTRSERLSKFSNDPPLSRVNTLRSREDRLTLTELMKGRNDQVMFNTGVLDDEEVVAKKEVSTADLVTTGGEVVTTVGDEDSAATTLTIFMDDITIAKELVALMSAKPMVKKPSVPKDKRIVMQELKKQQ